VASHGNSKFSVLKGGLKKKASETIQLSIKTARDHVGSATKPQLGSAAKPLLCRSI